VVILIAIGIFFTSFFPGQKYMPYIAIIFALPLAILKVYKMNLLIHNLTELMIYPSIAAVFVSLLNFWTVIILLVLISLYDMWAVWKSGIMQKMAKYQMKELKIFSGFFIPYISSKLRAKLNKLPKSKLKNKKIKANVAILGGGDVVFPIIAAGVMLRDFGLWPAIFVIIGAALGLSYLLFFAEKKKFYPAMPFITAGILLGIVAGVLVF
jgi:presenilin-like A22 family membrane protease